MRGKGDSPKPLRQHQFEAYLDKVLAFSARVAELPDGRSYYSHSAKKVFDAVFLGSACQFGSLHRIETECRVGALRHRIGALSEDTIGYTLERQDPSALLALGCVIARQLKRNQVLTSSWSRGRIVAAIDGIEICSSFARCCPHCLERKVEHKVGEELREEIQYYHRISVVTLVSGSFPIPLGLRFQTKGEDEVACTLALLEDLRRHLGPRFFDVLVGDALYLQTPLVNKVEALGWDWVFNLKGNQPELLAEAERLTASLPPHPPVPEQPETLQLWNLPQVDWPVAQRDVHVVKTLRSHTRCRQQVQEQETGEKKIVRVGETQTSTNYYASNLELNSIPPFFIHQLGRSRWDIDVQLFQTLTTQGHLKRPSLHQGYEKAFVVLTMIRLLAFTLALVFYYRQVRSHWRKPGFGFCDFARRMAELFLFLPAFDSS
jgi:hypothetical protein